MQKIIRKILLSFLLLFVLASCKSNSNQNDNFKIVSLAPNVTEIICALGSEDCLVGRTDYCNYPESVSSITSVGNLYDINTELIVSLKPDAVIASSIVDSDKLKRLEDAGIQTYQFNEEQNGIEGAYNLILETGRVINKETEAQNLISNMKQRIKEIGRKISVLENKKSVIYTVGWGDFGDFAATGDTYLSEIIVAAGGINAAEDGVNWSISKELLLKANPNVVILPMYSYSDPNEFENYKKTEPYSKLSSQVVTMNGDIAERQGVRTADAVETIAKLLYPEIFDEK